MSKPSILQNSRPAARQVLQGALHTMLSTLAPTVASSLCAQCRGSFAELLTIALERARLNAANSNELKETQVRTLQAVLENGGWLTAQEIGERGASYGGEPLDPQRWMRDGRIFSLSFSGELHYPRYGLDYTYRPLPELNAILKTLAVCDAWTAAVWFEARNAWLGGEAPRTRVAVDALAVCRAAAHRRSGAHG